jgi:hypothetical protein
VGVRDATLKTSPEAVENCVGSFVRIGIFQGVSRALVNLHKISPPLKPLIFIDNLSLGTGITPFC